jgi:hypothetical protein
MWMTRGAISQKYPVLLMPITARSAYAIHNTNIHFDNTVGEVMKQEIVNKAIKLAVLAQHDFEAFKQEVSSLNMPKEDFQELREWFNRALQLMVDVGAIK